MPRKKLPTRKLAIGRPRKRLLVYVIAFVVLTGLSYKLYSRADTVVPTSGVLVKNNCAPAAATNDGTMVWNSTNAKGVYDAYIGDTNCNGRPLLPAYNGQRGAADMTKDGRYVLLVTAVGWDKAYGWAAPGKGSGNAIELYDRQTGRLSTLLAGGTASQRGVIWPMFDPTGTRIVWSQMVKTTLEVPPWGVWQLHTASIDFAHGTLTNITTWQQPGTTKGVYEPYGWIPGTNKIIFMSTAGQTGSMTTSMQLFTLPDSMTGAALRISPEIKPYWPWQRTANAYHEFAHFAPNDPNTVYTSIGTGGLGADLWAYKLNSAGSNGMLAPASRISYFGGNFNATIGNQAVANFPAPAYRIVGGMAWANGGWVAGVCSDINCTHINAYRITLPH